MNTRPIETARDADLRLSRQAMQRAALRARELAAQTGTFIVISRDGVIELVDPRTEVEPQSMQEPSSRYREQP